MSQNIDQYLKNIKYEGSQIVDVLNCVEINQLSFAKQKFFKKHQPDPQDIQVYFEKAKEVSSDQLVSETIAEVGLFLKQRPFQNVDTKIINDTRICREIYQRVRDVLEPDGTCKTLFDIYDLSYITKIKMQINSVKDKEIALRQVYNYINWILLHQTGLKSIQTQAEQTMISSKNPSMQTPIQEDKKQTNDKLIANAHVVLIQLPESIQEVSLLSQVSDRSPSKQTSQERQILIVIGFNSLKSELFHAVEAFRDYNYNRSRLSSHFIPQYTVGGLCSILYHYFIVIRKIMRQNDTHLYDVEVKKILSANAEAIIKDPHKSKNLPKLQSFDQCQFQLFEVAHDADQLAQNLQSYSFKKILVLNLIEALDTLYILNTEDMAYNLISTDKYILTCFQYKLQDGIEQHLLSRQQIYETIIEKIYAIVSGDINLPKLIGQPIISSKKNKNKIIVTLADDLPQNPSQVLSDQTDDAGKHRHDPIMQQLKSTISTAMQWFDSKRYAPGRQSQSKTPPRIQQQSLSAYPGSLDQQETILKSNVMIESFEREKQKLSLNDNIETIPSYLRGFTRGLLVEEAETLKNLDSLLRKLDLDFKSNITKSFQEPSQLLSKILQIINCQTEIVNDLLPVLYQQHEQIIQRSSGKGQEICQLVLEEELDFFSCKLMQRLVADVEKIYATIECSSSLQNKYQLVDLFFNQVLNKYVNKKEKSFDLVASYIENQTSQIFHEFCEGVQPFHLFQESFLQHVLVTYFSGDTFEDFIGLLITVMNQRIDFNEEDSIIIYKLTSDNSETVRDDHQRYKMMDRELSEKRIFEKTFALLFCEELLQNMPKQMIYIFHHFSKIIDRESNTPAYHGQLTNERGHSDHYHKWAFLCSIYLSAVIKPRLEQDTQTSKSYTLFFESTNHNKKSKTQSTERRQIKHTDNTLINNLKLRRILQIVLNQPTDIARDNLLIVRRFFRKIDDLYYQNRMLSFAQNTARGVTQNYYMNLKNLEQVYNRDQRTSSLKYQTLKNGEHLMKTSKETIPIENQEVPPEPEDRSIFISQNYIIKAKYLVTLFDSFRNYLHHNFHTPHDFEGSLYSFMNKSKTCQLLQNQYGDSDDYIILITEKYAIDNIDVIINYQNKYKDGLPHAALRDDEIKNYLNISSSQQSQSFLELLSKMNNQSISQHLNHDSRQSIFNPYQIIFDQLNILTIVDLVQDMVNMTKIGRDILDSGRASYHSDYEQSTIQLFRKKVPKLLKNQRALQNYRIIQEVIDNDLVIIQNVIVVLKQKLLLFT